MTAWPRFARTPCCSDSGHVTNFNNEDFLSSILGDLNKHKAALRRAVPTATIIDGLELIAGPDYNTEKAAAVNNSGWAFDPVHPSKHVYVKMALNLLEKIALSSKADGCGGGNSDNRKRSWSSSNQGGGSGDLQRRGVQQPGRRERRQADGQEPAVERRGAAGQLQIRPLEQLRRRRRRVRPSLQRREVS